MVFFQLYIFCILYFLFSFSFNFVSYINHIFGERQFSHVWEITTEHHHQLQLTDHHTRRLLTTHKKYAFVICFDQLFALATSANPPNPISPQRILRCLKCIWLSLGLSKKYKYKWHYKVKNNFLKPQFLYTDYWNFSNAIVCLSSRHAMTQNKLDLESFKLFRF